MSQKNMFFTVPSFSRSVLFNGSNITINENIALKFIFKSKRSNIFRGSNTSIIMFKLKIIEKAEVMSHHKNFHILKNINGH